MFDLDKWSEIWATITRNKTRSILTGFGVFWGLFMFIILVGFGNGFGRSMQGNFEGFASNSAFFFTDRTSEPYKGYRKGRWWSMNTRDVEILREKALSVDLISPMIYTSGSTMRGNKTEDFSAMGVYPDFFGIQGVNVLHGRLLNNMDIDQVRKVCVVGREVYETLFDIGEDPVGEYIKVGGIYYTVVGVFQTKSQGVSIGNDPVRSIYIPFSTVKITRRFGDSFGFMGCTARKGYKASEMEEEVRRILKENHDISPADRTAVGGFNLEEQFKAIEGMFTGLNILIWIVGMGALFSGVIGISNIMLVTVRERTREIGVRRALGAKPAAIVTQIMSESLVLTAIAGIVGFLVSVGIISLLQAAMSGEPSGDGLSMTPYLSFGVAVSAMAILIVCGVLAGLMPAMRAMRIKAIDAIRDE